MSAPNNVLSIDTSTNRIAVGLIQFAKDEKIIVKDDALRHAEYASELIKEIVESSNLNLYDYEMPIRNKKFISYTPYD